VNAPVADLVAPGGKRGSEHGVDLQRGTLKKEGLHLEEVKRNRRFFRRRGVFIFLKCVVLKKERKTASSNDGAFWI
jgi:hypothetical protein